LPIADFRRQLEVNLTAQLFVTQTFLPLLGTDETRRGPRGRVVMMSSISGRSAAPFVGPYSASKFGLEGLSESLRRELMLYGIDVIIIGPGSVATPIWDKAEKLDISIYGDTEYAEAIRRIYKYMIQGGRKGYPPEKVGDVVWHALITPKPHV